MHTKSDRLSKRCRNMWDMYILFVCEKVQRKENMQIHFLRCWTASLLFCIYCIFFSQNLWQIHSLRLRFYMTQYTINCSINMFPLLINAIKLCFIKSIRMYTYNKYKCSKQLSGISCASLKAMLPRHYIGSHARQSVCGGTCALICTTVKWWSLPISA